MNLTLHGQFIIPEKKRVKSVNSILPLPQNVATLNPGQIIVDVSDQPIYALSKQLKIMFPNQFGPGKYFPILGKLHIEMVLLDIHGQLVEGSGLS